MNNQSKNPKVKSTTKQRKKSVLEYEPESDDKYYEDKEYISNHSYLFTELNQKTFYYED